MLLGTTVAYGLGSRKLLGPPGLNGAGGMVGKFSPPNRAACKFYLLEKLFF
jgi:hypothetical protein